MDGTVPTSGTLKYDNSVFKSGCIVVGDYAVTFNADGTTSTEKGECAPSVPTIESCPGLGCKYIYTTSTLTIGTSTEPSEATNDYTTLTSHPYFLGLISDSNTGIIERTFACGIEGTTLFCLEGYDTIKWSDGTNTGVLDTVYPRCNASASDSRYCYGFNVNAGDVGIGFVAVDNGIGACMVYDTGNLSCSG